MLNLFLELLRKRHRCGEGPSGGVKWYRKAAEQENAQAQNQLANCYYFGHGVPTNLVEAVKWIRKAADHNEPTAQNNLGDCYPRRTRVGQDNSEAVKWFRKAAEKNNADAQYNLALLLCPRVWRDAR